MNINCVLLVLAVSSFKLCLTNRTNYQLGLMDHLMDNYGRGYARPVLDGKSPTKIIFRCLLGELIQMNTREQTLAMSVYLKMMWKDEFLGWNESDWGNITSIHIPVDAIWFPDLTLYNNVDNSAMIRLPTNMQAVLNADGTVMWLSPAILTSSCHQMVKYFPFDTQVCLLRFSSWSAHIEQIDFWPESGTDSAQNRFLEDGTWQFINVTVERRLVDYACCSQPFSELFYYVLFRRRPEFYITYLIVPCTLLCMLSLLVFYLPPDCGEKLTLAITNLLALVVFQQLISETMPPTSDAEPILGTFFTIMIVMVCCSVVFTVIVIRVGFNACPMPSWVEWLFIGCLGKCVCLAGKTNNKKRDSNATPNRWNDNNAAEFSTGSDNGYASIQIMANNQNVYAMSTNANNDTDSRNYDARIIRYLESIQQEVTNCNSSEDLLKKWKLLATIIDRIMLYSFAMLAGATTAGLTFQIFYESEQDYTKQIKTYFVNTNPTNTSNM